MVTKAAVADPLFAPLAKAGCWRPEDCAQVRPGEICWRCQEHGEAALVRIKDAGLGVLMMSPDAWRHLEDDAYTLHGMLNWAESEDRGRVATLTRAFGIMRELLKRRPEEFGGPKEVR